MGIGGDRPPRRRTTPRGAAIRARTDGRRTGTTGVACCLGLVAATTLLSACTAAMPPGYGHTPLAVSPAPVLTTIDGMTAVPENLECSNEHLDGRRSTLPGPQLFPAAFPGVVDVMLVLPGPDASDARCHPTLVKRFSCRDTTTWAWPDPTEFLLTLGARQVRVVEGASAARTRSTEDGRDPGPPQRTFTYAEYTLATGDPQGAVAFERRAFGTCAPGPAQTVDGVAVHTATVRTETGLVDVAYLAVRDRLAQVALTGNRWAAGERDQAWRVVARYLQQED